MARRRLGSATIEVLQAIAAGYRYGFDIMEATGLAGGTVYPALAALERDALLRSSWEDAAIAHAEKRPPRRYYEVSAQGARVLQQELERFRRLDAPMADSAQPTRDATERRGPLSGAVLPRKT